MKTFRWSIVLLPVAVFALALWPRLNVPPQLVTADEDTWLGLSGNFAAALASGRPERTYQVGHPGVTALWASLAGMGWERARSYAGLVVYDPRDYRVLVRRAAAREPEFIADLNAARRGHAFANALLVAAFSMLVWRLLGLAVAVLCGVLLALDPFLVAHAQVIRMDSLQAGFLGVGLLAALVRWTNRGSRGYIVLAGISLGLAFLSKVSSVLVAGPLLLCAGWWTCQKVRRGEQPSAAVRALMLDLGALGVSAIATSLVGFPALWAAPLWTVDRIIDYALWNGGSPPESGNFFLGQLVADPGPFFYPLAMLFRLTPMVLLGLVAATGVGWRKLDRVGNPGPVLGWLAITVAVFVLVLTAAPKKFDRYLLPIWPELLLLAAVGLGLAARLAGRLARPVTAGIIALTLAQVLWLPPVAEYALAYYNPLLGGAAGARQAILMGWGEGLEASAAYLNSLPDSAELSTSTLYADALRPNLQGRSLPLARYAEANFLLHYINMEQRRLLPVELEEYVGNRAPEYSYELQGVRLAALHRLPRPEFGDAYRLEQYTAESATETRGERFEVDVAWTPLAEAATGWRARVELLDDTGAALASAIAPTAPAPIGQRASTALRLRLPDQRATLTLAVSVLDEGGNPVPPTMAPPWARAEAARVVFPSIIVRVR